MSKRSITIIDWATLLVKLPYEMIAYGVVHIYVIGKNAMMMVRRKNVRRGVDVIPARLKQSNIDAPLQPHVLQGLFMGTEILSPRKKKYVRFLLNK